MINSPSLLLGQNIIPPCFLSTKITEGCVSALLLSFLKFPCRVWQKAWAHSSVLHTFLSIRLQAFSFLSPWPLKTTKISSGFPAAGNCPCCASTQNSGAWREKRWQGVDSLHCCLFLSRNCVSWVLVVSSVLQGLHSDVFILSSSSRWYPLQFRCGFPWISDSSSLNLEYTTLTGQMWQKVKQDIYLISTGGMIVMTKMCGLPKVHLLHQYPNPVCQYILLAEILSSLVSKAFFFFNFVPCLHM